MFNLFKNNKSNSFPKETEPGNVYIKGDKLYFEDHGNEEFVDLSILKYAYVEILGDRPFLFLFDYYQHYIAVQQNGFSTVYPVLSARFGFDDQLFFKIINQKKELKQRIWLKKQVPNFEIIAGIYKDYADGFEVECNPPKFISWDTIYTDFDSLNVGHVYKSEFDSNCFIFDFPVRIGNMLVNGLEFYYDNDRKDIAIQTYFCNLYNEAQNDGSYNALRKLWMNEIPTDIEDVGYEREDQQYLSFDMNDVSLSICYTYDKGSQYDDGSVSLSITNRRDYSSILTKNIEDLKLGKVEVITFDSVLEFIPDYRRDSKVMAIPKVVKEQSTHHNALWIDKEKTKFGFTGDQYSIVFDKKEIESIIIQNVLPAKGGGYVELLVKPKSGYLISIYYGNQNELDKYADRMEKFLNINIEMAEPYYNC
jgi:hypothetical protein